MRLALVAVVLFVGVACSSGVGFDGALVGGACRDDRDCAEECVEKGDFPDGTCTIGCDEHRDCPRGTWCIDKEGGICLLGCFDDRDCRSGYDCKEKDAEGDPGDEQVCIK